MSAEPSLTPLDFARQLKERVALEQLVAEYVPSLARKGSSWKGLCPFHKEKTPSFHVQPELGFYHCFGCGAHGDAIKLIQELEKVDFMIALEMLARRAGLKMPVFHGGGRGEGDDRRLNTLRELCDWACKWFVEQLHGHAGGTVARQYLQRRGLSADEIERYRLGYAPDEYEGILQAAGRRGWSNELIAEAGLASRTDRGTFVDRFRNRVMFPIHDRTGQIVAFAGRLLEQRDDAPKYINSAETPLFRKSQLLYGLAAARDGIKQTGAAVLLEGYMDWLTLHRHGITNVLAGMGTALTEDQARLVRRLTGRVDLLYDGDEAGRKAMFRAAELLLRQGLDVHVAALPEGHDPDTFLLERGTQVVRDILSEAPRAIDYFLNHVATDCDLNRPEGKADAVGRLAPLLVAVEDPALREGYLSHCAGRLGLRLATLEAALRRRTARPYHVAPALQHGIDSNVYSAGGAVPRAEQILLYVLLRTPQRWDLLQQVQAEWFQDSTFRAVFDRIYDRERDIREGADLADDAMLDCDDQTIRDSMSRILLLPGERFQGEIGDFSIHVEEALQLSIMKLRRQWIDRRKRQLSQDLEAIRGENPLGRGELAEIDRISKESIQLHERFLSIRPSEEVP